MGFTIHFLILTSGTWTEVTTINEPIFDQDIGVQVALFGNQTLIASSTNVYPVEDYFHV